MTIAVVVVKVHQRIQRAPRPGRSCVSHFGDREKHIALAKAATMSVSGKESL